jgi:predicted site-specific integrase-resolvase
MKGYLKRNEACEAIGVHYHTLYKLAELNEIETIKIGSQQYYNVDKYIKSKGFPIEKNKKNICYCRVSSAKQKEDLKRQIDYMKNKYPYHEIISDVASGLNFKRDGLNKIINYAIDGQLGELVIAYKDRLARFGYELIENIIKERSDGKIIIINNNEEMTPSEEISKDILSIMNVYVAKMNGLRKYKKAMKDEIEKAV